MVIFSESNYDRTQPKQLKGEKMFSIMLFFVFL